MSAPHKIARRPGHAIPVGFSRADTSGGKPPLAHHKQLEKELWLIPTIASA